MEKNLADYRTRRKNKRLLTRSIKEVSHVSLKVHHIVVRLPSPCRSWNTKLQSRAYNLHITIYLSIQDYFRSGLILE
jgi:hypothetical protein